MVPELQATSAALGRRPQVSQPELGAERRGPSVSAVEDRQPDRAAGYLSFLKFSRALKMVLSRASVHFHLVGWGRPWSLATLRGSPHLV